MKKFKRYLGVLCAVCMILTTMAPAFAAEAVGYNLLRNKPYNNTIFTVGADTKTYPITVTSNEPCIRVWAQNTDTQGSFFVQLVDGDGSPKGATMTLDPGESDYFDVSFYGDNNETWNIEICKKSGDVSKVSGMFAARMENSWTKFD